MEHLDSLPPCLASSPSPTSSPHLQPPLPAVHYDYGLSVVELMEGHQTYSINTFSPDAVDGVVSPQFQGAIERHFRDQVEKDSSDKYTPRGLNRSSSGRSYPATRDTNYYGTPPPPLPNSRGYPVCFEGQVPSEPQSLAGNQENVPPIAAQSPSAEVLIPLRPSNPHRGYSKSEGYATSLRPTASVNAADHLRPFRMASHDPAGPVRTTKSSSELLPLKPTNTRHHESYNGPHPGRNLEEALTPTRPPSVNGCCGEEPLISLAEGARLRKEREWFEAAATQSLSTGADKPTDSKVPSSSLHNISTSSIGSSDSGSVFPSTTEGSDSLNSTLNSSLSASLNATLTVISTGSYQPSREVSKPFEMSDFYKYSTKFRRKSSSSGGNHENSSHESPSPLNGSPISPSLPPRSSQLVMNAGSTSAPAGVGIPPASSPSLLTPQSSSSPAPQQKGLYQPLTPLTCKPLEDSNSDSPAGDHLQQGTARPQRGSWEYTPIHQAVPVNVTSKRSATLV